MQTGDRQRVALVTGAAQGIGAAIARALARRGMRVHVADISEIPADRLGEGAVRHRCDLGQRAQVHALVQAIESADGGVDVLVNAAGGVCGQQGRPIEEIDEGSWHALFAANVDSAFWLAQAVAPSMRARGSGRIVFIASGAGLRPSLTGIQGYTAAKHALVGLTKQLSQDLGRYGITCNAVAPGFVRSNPSTEKQWLAYGEEGQRRLVENIHVRRLGTVEDIANAVMFFVGEDASWVSGQILSVDGGRS